MESVEHTQRNHQCHGGHSDTRDADGADDVDNVRALARKQVPACNVEGEIHALFFQQGVYTLYVVQ